MNVTTAQHELNMIASDLGRLYASKRSKKQNMPHGFFNSMDLAYSSAYSQTRQRLHDEKLQQLDKLNNSHEINKRFIPNGAQYLTTKDIARQLQVSPKTVNRLVKNGYLPEPIKLGSRNRWSKQSVDEAIERFKPQSRQQVPTLQSV